jgi:hypothetical protein
MPDIDTSGVSPPRNPAHVDLGATRVGPAELTHDARNNRVRAR